MISDAAEVGELAEAGVLGDWGALTATADPAGWVMVLEVDPPSPSEVKFKPAMEPEETEALWPALLLGSLARLTKSS